MLVLNELRNFHFKSTWDKNLIYAFLTKYTHFAVLITFALFVFFSFKTNECDYFTDIPRRWVTRTDWLCCRTNGPLARYLKLRVAHASGMPGTFSPPSRVSDPDMHHGTCVTHVPWCMPGSLVKGSLWSQWRGKRSRYSRRMRNPQFYVPGKRPMPVA